MEYYAQRTLYSELVGVLIKLSQSRFEEQRKDLTDAFGKEIASVGLYTAPQRLGISYGIIRFVGSELQSRALIKQSFEIAKKKWREVFGEELRFPEISTDIDEELRRALSVVVMLETKPSLPELREKTFREVLGK